jgi:hypothetical protein
MQALDPRRQLGGQRRRGFEQHSTMGAPGPRRSTVEAEPGSRLDDFSDAIDEIRNPELAVPQVDGDLAALAAPKELTLDGQRFVSGIHVLLVAVGTVRTGRCRLPVITETARAGKPGRTTPLRVASKRSLLPLGGFVLKIL